MAGFALSTEGWKEIAGYLRRSERSVQRWEAELGLPVRRVKTRKGQVVFALRSELDAWLESAELPAAEPSESAAPEVETPLGEPKVESSLGALRNLALPLVAVVLFLVVVTATWYSTERTPDYARASLTLSGQQMVSRLTSGEVLWTHDFGRDVVPIRRNLNGTISPDSHSLMDVDLDLDGEVDRLVPLRWGTTEQELGDGDTLVAFRASGGHLWSMSAPASVTCGGERFEGPWRLGAVEVSSGPAPRRVWASFIHHTWWPSLVMEVDSMGAQRLRYVQAGWVMSLREWVRAGRSSLVAGGVLNELARPSVVVFDPLAGTVMWPGESAPFQCAVDSVPPEQVTVFPPFEVAMAEGFSHLMVERVSRIGPRLQVEVGAHAVATIGESGVVEKIGHTDYYWTVHNRLSAASVLLHKPHICPEQHIPKDIRTWTSSSGWRAYQVTPGAPNRVQ
jgi:hypothetical protein